MTSPRPIALRETSAARMLDLSVAHFRRLVAGGALPPPVHLGDVCLWRTDDLEAILSGEARKPQEDFEI